MGCNKLVSHRNRKVGKKNTKVELILFFITKIPQLVLILPLKMESESCEFPSC